MAPLVRRLATLVVCTCHYGSGAASGSALPAGHHEDEPENEVSMLQASLRIRESLAGHAEQSKAVPTVVVDLDVAPQLRWRNVTAHYRKVGVFPACAYQDPLPDSSSQQARVIRAMKWDTEYLHEMQGIVADLGLPPKFVDKFMYSAIGYELSGISRTPLGKTLTGCSGLLAAMPNGTVVHGRNMDYKLSFATNDGGSVYLPDVTVEVLFMRGGRPLFTSVHWPFQIGVHTAMRFGGWSFEQNTRFHLLAPDIQYGLLKGSQGFALSARKIMETTPDFETAVQRLNKLNLMAPQYFIVAGPGPYQGAVISMDRGGVHKQATPLVTRLSSGTSSLTVRGQLFTDWNIIQTNDDLNKRPLDTRRPLEEVRLAESTQAQVGPSWAWLQMSGSTSPLYNKGTVFTTVYVPSSGYHRTLAHPGNGE